MAQNTSSNDKSGRRYMMAVVLGTAVSAFGTSSASAAAEISDKTLNDVSRYCTACWRNARLPVDQWVDCTQDVFKRLLTRIPAHAWQFLLKRDSAERRELIRSIDAVKKHCRRREKRYQTLTGIFPDSKQHVEEMRSAERTAVDHAAKRCLTPRQQSILQMCFEGWSVRDIARDMGIQPERVSDEKYKAVRKLQSHFNETHV